MDSANAVGYEQPNKRQRLSGRNDQMGSNGQVPIRTVYVGGTTCDSIDDINIHFGQFGEIESISKRFEDPRTHWCLVQFKRQEDAKDALLRTRKWWNGYEVRAADPWHQPDHPLQVAPEQDSDSNISVALNDDCLQAIFERLKPSSLTNVAGVCKRFNQQAKIIFALKHKHFDLSEQFYGHHDLLESTMKHFGKGIQSLSVEANRFSNEANAFHMIGQYCNPKLKQLELRNFQFQADSRSLRPIFSQIEQLKLQFCANSSGLAELLTWCGELKSILLSSCVLEDDLYILSQTFPKLQELSFFGTHLIDEAFVDFVSRHPMLIKLSFAYVQLLPRVLRTIGEHVENLQELKFVQVEVDNVQFQNDAAYIGQLSSLKKLQLDIEYSIVPLLNAVIAGKVPIESMEIYFDQHPDVDQAINCISQLKQIKILQLKTMARTRRVIDENVVELAKGLPELEELHLNELRHNNDFESEFSTIGMRKMLMHTNKLKLLKLRSIDSINIDVDDYMAMLNTVQKRKKKVPLVVEIRGRTDQVDVPAPILADNRSTFNIIASKH